MGINSWELANQKIVNPYLRDILSLTFCSFVIALNLIQRFMNIRLGSESWAHNLTAIWSNIAADVAQGIPLYVVPAADNKPPVWNFLFVSTIQNLPRPVLLIIPFIGNVLLISGVYYLSIRRYGFWVGGPVTLLLLGILPTIDAFLIQPTSFTAGLIVWGIFFGGSATSGFFLGFCSMFHQYGGFALPVFLLKLHREGGLTKQRLMRFIGGFLTTIVIPFMIVAMIWGWESLKGAIYWTFISPIGYILGRPEAEPVYTSASTQASLLHNPLNWGDLMLDVILPSVHIIIPATVIGVYVLLKSRQEPELIDVTAMTFLLLPLLVRGFPRYWLLAIPFMCLLTGKFLIELVSVQKIDFYG